MDDRGLSLILIYLCLLMVMLGNRTVITIRTPGWWLALRDWWAWRKRRFLRPARREYCSLLRLCGDDAVWFLWLSRTALEDATNEERRLVYESARFPHPGMKEEERRVMSYYRRFQIAWAWQGDNPPCPIDRIRPPRPRHLLRVQVSRIKRQRAVLVDGRYVPIITMRRVRSIRYDRPIRFTSGRHGTVEAGRWGFWQAYTTAENGVRKWVAFRVRVGQCIGRRARQALVDVAPSMGRAVFKNIRRASRRLIGVWLTGHREDAPFAILPPVLRGSRR